MSRCGIIFGTAILLATSTLADELHIDAAVRRGVIRPLHGVNGGPINYGGTIDLTKHWRAADIPLARLHDCEWPGARVVDFSAIYPDLKADPSRPDSYRFAETDDYLTGVLAATPGVVFRLGESIEHTPRKFRVHPPADPQRWADACVGVIRHYNEGWADGFRHNLRYWEIWNEPENRPACWTGTDEEFCTLYATAAKTIQARFPDVKVGGPAFGAVGEIENGEYRPTEFVRKFLTHCRDTKAPLDFFSWHTYTDDPRVYRVKAVGVRKLLDGFGFTRTEIHLNEWNYLPDKDWGPVMLAGQGRTRRLWYERMGGAEGAAFVASVLCDLQDAPVDAANLFTGDSSPFGLFTRDGEPKATFGAVRAFAHTLATPLRLQTSSASDGVAVLAGVNDTKSAVTILVTNDRGKAVRHTMHISNLPWPGKSAVEADWIDRDRNFERTTPEPIDRELTFELPAPGVVVFRLTPAK